MDIPSLFMIPSAVSSGKVHSVFPNSTDADFDFNRDSDATRVNSEGLIERVGYYGSELVTNGDFSNGTNNWNFTDANGQVGSYFSRNEVCEIDFTNTSTIYASQSNILINSKSYKITLDYYIPSTNASANYIQVRLGNTSSTSALTPNLDVLDNWTSITLYGVSNGTDFYIYTPSGAIGDKFYIDNVSVKEITGDRARLNYEIEGGLVNTKPSLLLEGQSTNSFPNSEDYTVFTSASAGTGTNPIITSNYSISPDGTKNADRIQFNRGSGTSGADTSYITKSLSLGTIDATLSIYLKTNDGTTKDVTLRLGAAIFDYDVTVTSEWQRFTLSGNTNVDRIQIILYGNKNSETADLSCFGTQVESLTYATSYIPTNGSTQTRAAETCNGAGTSSIFESSEGILYTEISVNGLPSSGFLILGLNDGTVNNNVFIEIGTNGLLTFFVISGGTNVASKVSSVNPLNNFVKCAIRYKLNDVSFWINGTEIHSDTSATMPVGLSQLDFDYGNGSHKFYGNVRDIRVYNTKEMTDSEVDILLTKITS